MVKQVIWGDSALADIDEIFEYWETVTGSSNYNLKLFSAFQHAAKLIESNNYIGRATTREDTYRLVVLQFVLYYKLNTDHIRILALFDTRRNPDHNPIE
jgi:plasmid stabilization system protein ParE